MATLQWATSGTVSGLGNNQQGNSIAQALATLSQNATPPTPSTTGLTSTAGLLWHDTTNNQLKLRDQGDTTWMTLSAVDEVNKQAVLHHGGCRFTFASATQVKLGVWGIPGIKINGLYYAIPPAGITASPSSTFVSGVASTALAASTAYLVYLFNNSGTLALDFWPLSGGHITDGSAGNVGVEVRNNSGTPDSTRTLVGAVLTNASAQFQDSQLVQGVATWFNRRRRFVIAGFASSSTSSPSLTTLANSSVTAFQWSDQGDYDVAFNGETSMASGAPVAVTVGITFDGTAIATGSANTILNNNTNFAQSFYLPIAFGPEGFHTIATGGATSAGTVFFGGSTTVGTFN